MNRIDQTRLVSLRLERGLAVRELARDCGIEIAVLNRLETSDDPSLTTLSTAALIRLADRLGVPVGHLFTDDRPGPEVNAADTARLGALLVALGQDTAVVATADALGWTTTRVHDAAADLTTALRPVGLTVFKNNGLMSIRPADDTHADAVMRVARHPRARRTQRLLTAARARVLYQAEQRAISPHSLSNSNRVNIATLLKAGLLVEGAKRHYEPAADVLQSLYPEDEPTSRPAAEKGGATRCRATVRALERVEYEGPAARRVT